MVQNAKTTGEFRETANEGGSCPKYLYVLQVGRANL
jgi:hypothetical protein